MKYVILGCIAFTLFFPTNGYAADLGFSAQKKVYVGDEFPVAMTLSGGEKTIGTDVILQYDKDLLEPVRVTQGTSYATYNPVETQRIQAAKGIIVLSGSASVSKPVLATGLFGTVYFRAKKEGMAKISYVYEKGSTSKTGVVDVKGKELLTKAPMSVEVFAQKKNIISTVTTWLSEMFRFLPFFAKK